MHIIKCYHLDNVEVSMYKVANGSSSLILSEFADAGKHSGRIVAHQDDLCTAMC